MEFINKTKEFVEDMLAKANFKKHFVLIAIIVFFILWFLKRNIIIFIAFGVVLILYDKFYNKKEEFDIDGSEFVPIGTQRYDLRGAPIESRPGERHRSKDRCCCNKI